MGPIVLFYKSFIEMLSVDEAAIFDFMFSSNICPIFYVETLADLEKNDPGKRTREKVVADVAGKTPQVHSYPNGMHTTLLINELAGNEVKMQRLPIVLGGRAVRHAGKVGVFHQESPEMQAFNRWHAGNFEDVERTFAHYWRLQMAAADLGLLAKVTKHVLARHADPRNEREAYELAKESISGVRNRYRVFRAAYSLLGLPPNDWPRIVGRWKAAGGPPLREYAPYTAYCLLVEVFFKSPSLRG